MKKHPAIFLGALLVLTCPAAASAEEQVLPDLFERVNPAVVEILTSRTEVSRQGPLQTVQQGGLGSGFLISDDGRIMTAAHVVHVVDEIAVRFVTGDTVRAKVLASDQMADVALIQTESVPEGIAPVLLADSDKVRVGDDVFIVGAPFGIAHTLTAGHISARRTPDRVYSGIKPTEFLQTDAAINKGNSGGPMFDMAGEVVGIVSYIISSSGGFEGLGFVATSNLAKEVLLENPSWWSGMEGLVVTGELAPALNIPQAHAVLVQRVAAGSPASTLGLRPGTIRATIEGRELLLGGDIILAVQGISLADADALPRVDQALMDLQPSAVLEVLVLRGNEQVTLRKAGYLLRN